MSKIIAISILSMMMGLQAAQAQVGFNNPNPHSASILDLKSTDKGILIPRMTSLERQSIEHVDSNTGESAIGLMVFDTDDQAFYYFHASEGWIKLNNWKSRVVSNNTVIEPTSDIVEISGRLKLSNDNSINEGFNAFIDADQGVQFVNHENGPINFYTNNVRRVSIASNGTVGIGVTTLNQNVQLHIGGSQIIEDPIPQLSLVGTLNSSSADIIFRNTVNVVGKISRDGATGNIGISNINDLNGHSFTVKQTGDVGIGERLIIGNILHTPLAQLHVQHSTGFPGNQGVAIENTDSRALWHINADNESDLTLYEGGSFKGQFLRSDGTYAKVSDLRLKKHIDDIAPVLDKIMNLKVKTYLMKDQGDTEQKNIGFIAQELLDYFPEAVHYNRELDLLSVTYSHFGPIAIKAIQEQQQIIKQQEQKILHQEHRIEELSQRIAQVEALLEREN